MTLEIWILEDDVERLKKLQTSMLSSKDSFNDLIRYKLSRPMFTDKWICVHIQLDEYITLTDYNLLIK